MNEEIYRICFEASKNNFNELTFLYTLNGWPISTISLSSTSKVSRQIRQTTNRVPEKPCVRK